VKIGLDTNILAYAEGIGNASTRRRSLELIERLPLASVLIPAQCLGELYRVLTGKARRAAAAARAAILSWADTFEVVDSTWTAFQSAFDLSVSHHFRLWDALILSVCAERRCRLLLSEDLQHGFTWRGMTVVNPYRFPDDPLLVQAIQSG
jgi:predicted nucleic acid-binding protein